MSFVDAIVPGEDAGDEEPSMSQALLDAAKTDPEPEPDPEPQDDGYIQLDENTRLSRQEAEAVAHLYRELEADPQRVAAAFAEAYLTPQQAPQQQYQQPRQNQPQDFDQEWVDPQVRYLHGQVQDLQQRISARELDDNRGFVSKALGDFQEKHALSDDEAQLVADEAARLRMLSTASAPDPYSRVEQALENTLWLIPSLREKEFAARQQTYQKDRQRQRKLAGISGTSGSVPRNAGPVTKEESRAAMVADIAAAMERPQES